MTLDEWFMNTITTGPIHFLHPLQHSVGCALSPWNNQAPILPGLMPADDTTYRQMRCKWEGLNHNTVLLIFQLVQKVTPFLIVFFIIIIRNVVCHLVQDRQQLTTPRKLWFSLSRVVD